MAGPDYPPPDFPFLRVAIMWIVRHCIIPDGFKKGTPFVPYRWQAHILANHYRVKDDAVAVDEDGYPTRAAAFVNRRTQVVAAQKTGKGPFAAAVTSLEAVGPALFAGWAQGGEIYRCQDHGCQCGWAYVYSPGEPMGMPWEGPLIQLLATSQDQVDNVYRPLQAMARGPYLSSLMRVGESFIRLPSDGKIETVTSSALSRLGNPISFCLQDETQLYTESNKLVKVAETMRRGLGGMGGRSIETTNCWDPAEHSTAQRTYEAKAKDVFKFYDIPPRELKWSRKADRIKILEYNYLGSPHVPVASVLAEAEELNETDPGQAERFYGNRIVAGHGVWMAPERWTARAKSVEVPDGALITLGFDGSDIDDWTGFRCQTREGHQFTPTFPDGRPMIWNPADFGGQIPRLEVSAGLAHIMATYKVARGYFDPPYWTSEIDAWAELYGDDVVIGWRTQRPTQMHSASERLYTDLGKADTTFTHDGCQITELHVVAAHKSPRPSADAPGRYILRKPGDGRKIDMAIPSILAHEAWGDVTQADGWPVDPGESFAYFI